MAYPGRRYLLAVITVAAVVAAGLLSWRLCMPPALYRMTILPPLGGRNTHAMRLNDHGQVVGLVYDAGGHTRPFLWDRTHGVQDLGLGGGCWGLAINNAGQIAGTMPTDPNCQEVFLWEPGKGRTMLGTLGGKKSFVCAMNNRGQIVGISSTADGAPHAFLWDRETGMRELSAPDESRCWPASINDAGQILVMSLKQPLVRPRPWFLLDPNGPRPLAPLLPDTQLLCMNAGSCAVAVEKPGAPTSYLLFRDERGAWRRLYHTHDQMSVTRLNDKNQVACTTFARSRWEYVRNRLPRRLFRARPRSFETVSYLWDPVRGRVPLDRYLQGVKEFWVEDLNNNGCIVGRGSAEDGNPCSVLLEPVPERWDK